MKIKYLEELFIIKNEVYDLHSRIKLAGYSEEEINSFELVFGQPFPIVYKEWLYLGGKNFFSIVTSVPCDDIGFFDILSGAYDDYIKDLTDYSVPLDGGEIFICIGHESQYYWIRSDEGDDPQVNYFFVDGRHYPKSFEIKADRLTDFVNTRLKYYFNKKIKMEKM